MFQQVILIGNVGKDPEFKVLANGSSVVKFSIATERKYFNNDNTLITDTEWHNVTAFGKKAEAIRDYVKKGAKLMIQGRNKSSTFEKEGQKHRRTEVVIDDMKFLSSKKEQSDEEVEEKPKQQKPKSQQKPKKVEDEIPTDWEPSGGDEEQPSDDIPF